MVNKQLKAGVIYRGPSLIDGQPIVAIATYSDKNTKTGQVLQTYILLEDIDPRYGSKKGLDVSICGNCPMRGLPTADPKRKIAKERECYVRIDQGPLLVWKAYRRGVYPMATNQTDRILLGLNRVVRVGTYGDPAAIPSFIWDQLLTESETWMAYTHQKPWRPDRSLEPETLFLQGYCKHSYDRPKLAQYRPINRPCLEFGTI